MFLLLYIYTFSDYETTEVEEAYTTTPTTTTTYQSHHQPPATSTCQNRHVDNYHTTRGRQTRQVRDWQQAGAGELETRPKTRLERLVSFFNTFYYLFTFLMLILGPEKPKQR